MKEEVFQSRTWDLIIFYLVDQNESDRIIVREQKRAERFCLFSTEGTDSQCNVGEICNGYNVLTEMNQYIMWKFYL